MPHPTLERRFLVIRERRKSKALLALETAWIDEISNLLRSFGGQQIQGNRFALQTKAGRLEVQAYPEFIACRFDDVSRACEVVGSGRLNPHSGKWNFGQGMLFDCTKDTRRQVELQVLGEFVPALAQIVVLGPVDLPRGNFTLAGFFQDLLDSMTATLEP